MAEEKDPIICYCIGVRKSTLVQSIKEGNTTVEALRGATRAGSGCRGCISDLEKLIADHKE